MDLGYLENSIDRTLLAATKERNMSVAAIILLEPASRCIDPQLGEILQHPDNDGGVYTMPNMTTLEGLNCYAAALDLIVMLRHLTFWRKGIVLLIIAMEELAIGLCIMKLMELGIGLTWE